MKILQKLKTNRTVEFKSLEEFASRLLLMTILFIFFIHLFGVGRLLVHLDKWNAYNFSDIRKLNWYQLIYFILAPGPFLSPFMVLLIVISYLL